MAFKVLIPQDVAKVGKNYLLERGYEIKAGSGITIAALMESVKDCDAILARTAPYPAEVLKAGKKLKVIARHGVGFDNIDVETATELGIYVTNAPLSNANSVAEHAIGLIIACAKNLVRIDNKTRNGDFEIRNRLKGIELEGKILGLIGVGRIGNRVAKKAISGFGMKVIAYDPYINKENLTSKIELVKDLNTVFEVSDFVSLHLPATKETKGLISKSQLKMMKTTAYLINTARGEIVDEAALFEALDQREIAGAALDVFQQEPPKKNNPLFDLSNIIVTPHNAAHTKEAMNRMSLHAAIGIDEVLSGKKPSWPVNSPKF